MEKKSLNDNTFGLNLMQTIAIVMILFGHSLSIYPPNQSLMYQIGLFCGFFGVEVFFVVSGFLVGRFLYKIYLEDGFSLTSVINFLKKYGLRFLPVYYLVLIINLIISFSIGYAVLDWWKYFFFLQNFNSAMLPFFPESWPLSVAFFAFLLLVFTLYIKTSIVKPRNKAQFFFIVVLSLTLFFVLTKVYYAFTTQNSTLGQWNLALKAVVIYRLDAIFMGVLAAFLSLKFVPFWKKIKFLSAFLGIILFLFMFAGVGFFQLSIDQFPHFWNIFYLPLTSLSCVLFLPILSQWKSITCTFLQKPIVFSSLISYSIYVLHYGVILQLLQFYFPTDGLSMNELHLYSLCYFLITLLLATLLYKFFENPIKKLSDK